MNKEMTVTAKKEPVGYSAVVTVNGRSLRFDWRSEKESDGAPQKLSDAVAKAAELASITASYFEVIETIE